MPRDGSHFKSPYQSIFVPSYRTKKIPRHGMYLWKIWLKIQSMSSLSFRVLRPSLGNWQCSRIRTLSTMLPSGMCMHRSLSMFTNSMRSRDCCSDTALLTFYCIWLAIKTNDTTTWQQWVPTPTLVAPAPTGTPTLGESFYLLQHAIPLPVM